MDPNVSLQLLEYDKRFERYGSDYTFYDYNKPEELPSGLKNAFKVVVADPPYLVRTYWETGISAYSLDILISCFYFYQFFMHFIAN